MGDVWQQKQQWLEGVMADTRLKSGPKMLAFAIAKRAYGNKTASNPGREIIAKDLGLKSTGRLSDWKDALEAIGAVSIEILTSPGGKETSEYTIDLDFVPSTMVPVHSKASGTAPSTMVPDTEHDGAQTEHDGARYRAPRGSEYINRHQEKTPRDTKASSGSISREKSEDVDYVAMAKDIETKVPGADVSRYDVERRGYNKVLADWQETATVWAQHPERDNWPDLKSFNAWLENPRRLRAV